MMKIGIFGAGTMGLGITQLFAKAEENAVILCSSSPESAQRGKDRLTKQLNARVEKGKMAQSDAEKLLQNISIGTAQDCADCDLVIETVPEDIEKKKLVFKQLDDICKESCIFASNTSSIPISQIGEGLKHPVSGMHFFNPAPVMKLVEVISDKEELYDKIAVIARSVGKTPVKVKESPGFVVNRLLIPLINEAIGLYADGIATAEDIDTAMKLGANHPMGPLALGDLIGLDVCLAIMQVLHEDLNDDRYKPHPLLEKMVKEGKVGKKSRCGFYEY